jgi:hypothetical protein
MAKPLDWKPDTSLPVGKGATVQRYTASDGINSLEIDTKPWGEGDLLINGVKQAHVENEKTERRAFQDLETLAGDLEPKQTAPLSRADLGPAAQPLERRKPRKGHRR